MLGFTDILLRAIAGSPFSPEINAETLSAAAGDYVLQAFTSAAATWIAVGYAAIAAMLTRSVLGSLTISFLALIAEQAVLVVCFLVVQVFGISQQILSIYYFTPSYNFANISAWVSQGQGYNPLYNPFQVNTTGVVFQSHSLTASILIIGIYVIAMAALTITLFRRQDIVS